MLGDRADLWVYVPVCLRVLICPIMATQGTATEVCQAFEPMSLETKASFHDQRGACFVLATRYQLTIYTEFVKLILLKTGQAYVH